MSDCLIYPERNHKILVANLKCLLMRSAANILRETDNDDGDDDDDVLSAAIKVEYIKASNRSQFCLLIESLKYR